jgi:hypothetical protein
MSARYLRIDALQQPYDLGVDTFGRSKIQFNILAERTSPTGATEFEDEIVKILADAGVVITSGPTKNVFVGSNASIPSPPASGSAGPYLSVIATSGAPGKKIQNAQGIAYKNPTALIVVRATSYVAARAKAVQALAALEVVRNQTVTP